MANYKVPSQAASGSETWSDFLVGNQFTDGSSQMTNGTFALDETIPEKDSKEFITQPFSEFITLDDINQEVNTLNEINDVGTTNSPDIRFNNDKYNADRSYFGSLKQRLGVAVTDIITKYPAAAMVDISSPVGVNNYSAESITYDGLTNTTQFQIQYSLLYNPLDVVFIIPSTSILSTDTNIRNFYSSYTKYVVDLSGTTYNILLYSGPDSNNKITLKVEGKPFLGYTAYTQNYLIRPNNGITEEFYRGLDDVSSVLINRETNPKFNAGFNVPRDTNGGYFSETITEYANWPVSRDEWNIQTVGIDYDYYIAKISSYADEIDAYRSNLIVRFLTSPQLYEFDTEDKKIESIFQIYGQSFDQVKTFIDNIAYMRNITYDSINNVPDLLLKNLSETLGLSTVSLFDEKTLQDSFYTRHNTSYEGVLLGTNLFEAENEFYRRILVNLADLYKSKGTRKAIEFFLKFIGAPEPIIRLDEYIYRVENTLPSQTIEDDIQEAILGTNVVNIVEYTITTGFTGYTLTQLTGSTTLTRDEYPVDESTGLPRKIETSDGNMFFEKGAGWYKKTLDHRSPDILDESRSNLTGRTKTIKTMSKPFTYGEDYFNVYRKLPGLYYGYELISDIDNKKINIVNNEVDSRLILNRKNINVFLSSDRAIDYDIYRKSRDLEVSFGNLTPQTGKTFVEFLDTIINEVITNSHIVRYKNLYVDLSEVYKLYSESNLFTPYTYIDVNDFINRLSPYWVNIIEQFIPATTLWNGGNVIENGTFNRSKFKYQQPALPMSYTEILFPDFETVIYEDLEMLIGGGTIDGENAPLRGVNLFSGVTFEMYLNINGSVNTTSTQFFKPFSGFTLTYEDCTPSPLTTTSYYVPLMRGFGLFNGGNSIDYIKSQWKSSLNTLISTINSSNNNSTGFTLNAEYYTDIDSIDKVKFSIIYHDFYGRTGNEIFEYYFRPIYLTEYLNCTMTVSPSVGASWNFQINNPQGIIAAVDANSPVEIYSGSTYAAVKHLEIGDEMNKSGYCTYYTSLPGPSDQTILLFNDGGNCEISYTFSGTTGTLNPTYNYGLKKGTVVYRVIGNPVLNTYQDLMTAVSNNTVVETLIENVQPSTELLSLNLKNCNEIQSGRFKTVPPNYQTAFTYTKLQTQTQSIRVLSSSKTSIINNIFDVLPTSKVLVYSNINTELEDIPYRFTYKYPEDIYVRPSDNSRNGDYLINQYGWAIEVTGLTLNYGAFDVYYHILITETPTYGEVILFNGISGANNGIVVKYTAESL